MFACCYICLPHYEQMIGRAMRRCDETGKTVFKIYDPVGIYKSLDPVNTMKPLIKDPNITIDQLLDELQNPSTWIRPEPNNSLKCRYSV